MNLQAGKVERDMLDNLALLFARVKTSERPAKHVTATALKLSGTEVEIWIAKNDGSKGEDEQFRQDLEDWFNARDSPESAWCACQQVVPRLD